MGARERMPVGRGDVLRGEGRPKMLMGARERLPVGRDKTKGSPVMNRRARRVKGLRGLGVGIWPPRGAQVGARERLPDARLRRDTG